MIRSTNFKKFLLTAFFVVAIALVVAPAVTSAAPFTGLVKCGATSSSMCTFADFFNSNNGLIATIIDFILVWIIIPIAVISIAVAGFKMIIEGDKEKARTEAKDILISVFIGLFVAFAAWLIIKVILTTLVNPAIFNAPITYLYEHKT